MSLVNLFLVLGDDDSEVMYEVVFDEPFLGGQPLRYCFQTEGALCKICKRRQREADKLSCKLSFLTVEHKQMSLFLHVLVSCPCFSSDVRQTRCT